MNIKNLDYHEDRWTEGNWSVQDLIDFENDIISHWEGGEIRGPIHLSNGNEKELIKYSVKSELMIGYSQLGGLIIMHFYMVWNLIN